MSNDQAPERNPSLGLSRRHMILGAAALTTSIAAFVREPKAAMQPLAKGVLEGLVPKAIGPWKFETKSGLVLPPVDPLTDQIYSDIVTRVYVSEKEPPVMMLIAYSNTQNGMLQLHRPEVCYPASGFALTETMVESIAVNSQMQLATRHFSAEGASRNEQVLYWTRIGSELPTGWLDQRAAVVRANLRGVIPDGILVRLSTIAPDYKAARPVLEAFTRGLIEGLNVPGRKLLVGF